MLGPFFFQIGMQIYFIVPCTISSGVILGCGYNKELLWAWRICSTL
ncbi:unnamed protein product [Pocillopora meandrina]|uniref:Uncharacterized protein n=1 Tax=Pocillopora meandrina TaxID=46732 RepID=A0AAU9XPN2_9CNID|nr:unnamed protein product [Pocillopora meandrina]